MIFYNKKFSKKKKKNTSKINENLKKARPATSETLPENKKISPL